MKERIVVVDDEPSVRRLLARMLEPLGHEVLIATSAAEALAFAAQSPVDLVISDLKMPGMDGLTLLRHLREAGHDSAFILLTAFGELETVLGARDRYELSNFFVKPIFSRDKFLFDVISALSKRRLELENRRLIEALGAANQSLEQKVAERTQELIEKNAELTRLSNFRADALKVLTHELRTPVAILKGYLGLPPEGTAAGPHDLARAMRTAVNRVQEIVDQATQLRRALEPAPFQVTLREVRPAKLCAEVVERMRPLVAFRGITIELEAGPTPSCFWDARRIESVVEELLINAVRASQDGQAIQVRVRAAGETVEIAVKDQGVGIPAAERGRIFEPFVTLGPPELHQSGQFSFRAQGAGLGLAVTKLWVDLHGGELTVCDNGDEPGTTFLLRLPRHPQRGQAPEAKSA
jgi:signal transduction histidine kinase